MQTQSSSDRLLLGIDGFEYRDLYDISRLEGLAARFDDAVRSTDAALFARFAEYRQSIQSGTPHGGLTTVDESKLLIDVARHLGAFVTRMFYLEEETEKLRARTSRETEIVRFKKDIVSKRVTKVTEFFEGESLVDAERVVESLVSQTAVEDDPELALATATHHLFELEKSYPRALAPGATLAPSLDARDRLHSVLNALLGLPQNVLDLTHDGNEGDAADAAVLHRIVDLVVRWTATRWKIGGSDRWNFAGWTAFNLPKPLHFEHLVHLEEVDSNADLLEMRSKIFRRDGFVLTDPRMSTRSITDEAHYCLWCHERKKDSCSSGFVEKDGFYKKNPLSIPLTGCPLDERIGEMNYLRAHGESIASLAVVMIDNPMCPGTGHRICNDCMRSCIFQKQDPVDIPQIETGTLTDVLFLPYGFEIYSLFTRWNPINVQRPVMQAYNGRKILVVGLGPAGYTLAHYLSNEGFGVVGIDALKVEPLPKELVGADGQPPRPVRDVRGELWEKLDERLLAGFGGVSEYGITVRWDKNFLKVIRVALERKANVQIYGGIRFGGTLTVSDAFDRLGFDHIAIAAGAGSPTLVRMKNNLARGIRKASDFLMTLQLQGAFKKDSLANLQIRLPAIVIGGGLTASDTATELAAYYPVQVEKIRERYLTLIGDLGEDAVRSGYDNEELHILNEFLAHGDAVVRERERAAAAGERPDFVSLVRGWGGVTIAYRKSLTDSPAYRLNHEEVDLAMEEGLYYAERMNPVEAVLDPFGHVKAMIFEEQIVEEGKWRGSGRMVELPARSVMVAAGTSPNVIYEKEYPGTFALDEWGQYFRSYRLDVGADGALQLIEAKPRAEAPGFFTSYQHEADPRKLISFYGDNHPVYAGNVVKAMASAKHGYKFVVDLYAAELSQLVPETRASRFDEWRQFVASLDEAFIARVAAVKRLTPTIIEVVVRAPFAAEHFEPGQFYRLQNYEAFAPEIEGNRLTMEGLALTGAWTDRDRGLLSLIILEMGASSRLCAALKIGEPVVVMGPTGTPTEIPENETVLLAGGGLGNAVLFSIAKALKRKQCKVVYFAGYKKGDDVFKEDEIEAGTDQVVWAVDIGSPIPARRPQDMTFVGNIVQAIHAYASGEIMNHEHNSGTHHPIIKLSEVDRVIAIGSDGMMNAVKQARHGILAPYLKESHVGIGSINSPMLCMMKQVCAQCMQRHVDPVTGKETFVFSCFNQDQHLDNVDFLNLRARLRQNTVVEKLSNLWLSRLLSRQPLQMV